jgi:universal stress protein A
MTDSARRAGGPVTSILCPVDFSDHSRDALGLGVRLAIATGARLTALYVEDPLLAAAAKRWYDEQAIERQTESELRQFLTAASDSALPPEVAVEIHEGNPVDTICSVAKRDGCDLIVMSTQGVTGARKMLFGSTTEGVLRHARVPVMVVPPR